MGTENRAPSLLKYDTFRRRLILHSKTTSSKHSKNIKGLEESELDVTHWVDDDEIYVTKTTFDNTCTITSVPKSKPHSKFVRNELLLYTNRLILSASNSPILHRIEKVEKCKSEE